MPTATEKLILKEIQGIRNDGCFQGATNSAHIITIQATQKQHDQRIVEQGESIASVIPKIDGIQEQVKTAVKDAMPESNQTLIPVKLITPLGRIDTKVPARWIMYAAVIAMIIGGMIYHNSGMQGVKDGIKELQKHIVINSSTNGFEVAYKDPKDDDKIQN